MFKRTKLFERLNWDWFFYLVGMKKALLLLLFVSGLAYGQSNSSDLKGYLFVNVWRVYRGGAFEVLSAQKDTLFSFKNQRAFYQGRSYKMMDEDGKYKWLIEVELLDPEYGFFIMKVKDVRNGYYEVEFNDQIALIDSVKHKQILEFKSPVEFVMDGYSHGDENNPIRIAPQDDAAILEDYDNFSFLPVEVDGDWLKVKDSKDCYPGLGPSKEDLTGWIRWRKDGKVILDVRHSC